VTLAALLDNVVERAPLRQTSQGYSGATLERVVLADGRALVVKRLSPAWDVTMRLTHDSGRAAWLWTSGVMDRFPPIIDHTIVAAEPTDDGWVIAMRDASGALLPDDRLLTRAESRRLLDAAAALHRTFRGERIEGLCSLTDHLSLFSPQTAARELGEASPVVAAIKRGWELFPAVVPHDVAAAINTIHERPDRLANELDQCATTLIHGDLWLANVGLQPDCVVILDWGTATQAPPAFDFTTYLTGAWSRIMATREELIDDVRAASGDDHDERALQLSFIATFAEYGWNKALDATEHPHSATRAREAADLAWWIDRVRRALETIWSPV
jgi:thiamine kinase-like enzyme